MSDTVVVSDQALLQAYIHIEYRVVNLEMTLRARFTHSLLDYLMKALKVHDWACLTPVNPHSKVLSKEDNEQRLADFWHKLADYILNEREGGGMGSDWPPEKSYLIPD